MVDCHIHLERGSYTIEWLDQFVKTALARGMDEICLLEHSHRFLEFKPMYESVCSFSDYQREWFQRHSDRRLSIKEYTAFIEKARQLSYPVKIKFGLEVCYFEEQEKLIRDIIDSYPFDFVTGSVHWVEGFGFDHKKELWDNMDVDRLYTRYYEIMQNLIKSGLFTGVAHPDSIKAFGHKPTYDLSKVYETIAELLCRQRMYAEQSGGLHLNYGKDRELGMNARMLGIFINKGVTILTASDAHCPENVGANIADLQRIIDEYRNIRAY
jgi:histidinol-phosphatase (PHP family)